MCIMCDCNYERKLNLLKGEEERREREKIESRKFLVAHCTMHSTRHRLSSPNFLTILIIGLV